MDGSIDARGDAHNAQGLNRAEHVDRAALHRRSHSYMLLSALR